MLPNWRVRGFQIRGAACVRKQSGWLEILENKNHLGLWEWSIHETGQRLEDLETRMKNNRQLSK